MDVARQYSKELKGSIGYVPTWLPTITLVPGDVCRLNNFQYTKVTTLKDMGIACEVVPGQATNDFDYMSADSVTSEFKLEGQSPALGTMFTQAQAGVTIHFKRANAIVFRATGCTSSTLKELFTLGTQVLQRFHEGTWPSDLVLVTEVVNATGATILISSGADAEIQLAADAGATIGALNIADINANIHAVREQNVATRVVAQANLTPLFKAVGIKRHFFGDTTLENTEGPESELVVDDVDYEDFAVEIIEE